VRREFNRKRKRRNYVECVKGPMIEEMENMGERKRCVSVRERESVSGRGKSVYL
jgi:hypothetical protein